MSTFPAVVEGFDLIGSGEELNGKGSCYEATGTWALNGAHGNGALTLNNASDHISFNINYEPYHHISFWFRATTLKTQRILRCVDEINDTVGDTLIHAVLQLTDSGYLQVFKTNAVSGFTTKQQVIYPDVWHNIELRLHLVLEGSFVLAVDGVIVASASKNIDFIKGVPIYSTTVFRGQDATGFSFDDIVIGTSTDAPPSFLGAHEIITLQPNGDYDMGSWTGSHLDVNDPFGSHDGNGSYVSTTISGDMAIFHMEDLPTDANTIWLFSVIALGSVDTVNYEYGPSAIDGINESTGLPYTREEVNAYVAFVQHIGVGGGAEVRYTRTAFEIVVVSDKAGEARVTRMGIEVLAATSTSDFDPCSVGGALPPTNTTLCELPEYADWLVPLQDRFIHYVFEATIPSKEKIEWKTNVEIAHDGTEETTGLRKIPRTTITYRIPESVSRTADAFIDQYIAITKNWIVPLWYEAQEVADVSNGATSIQAITNVYAFVEGGYAVLYESPTKYQVLEVLTVSGASITLNASVEGDYSTPRLMPARVGTIVSNITKAHSGFNAISSITFEIKDLLEVAEIVPDQYNGLDIYYDENLLPQLANVKGSEVIYTRRDKLDFELNRFDRATPWKNSRVSRKCSNLVQGTQDILDFRGFLARRAGRLNTFWRPSFIRDLKVLSTGALINTLLVEAIGQLNWTVTRDHIVIRDKEGNWYPRKIVAYLQLDETTMQLTLDDVPLDIEAENIDMVSYLGVYRLRNDDITLEWLGNTAVKWSTQIIEVSP